MSMVFSCPPCALPASTYKIVMVRRACLQCYEP